MILAQIDRWQFGDRIVGIHAAEIVDAVLVGGDRHGRLGFGREIGQDPLWNEQADGAASSSVSATERELVTTIRTAAAAFFSRLLGFGRRRLRAGRAGDQRRASERGRKLTIFGENGACVFSLRCRRLRRRAVLHSRPPRANKQVRDCKPDPSRWQPQCVGRPRKRRSPSQRFMRRWPAIAASRTQERAARSFGSGRRHARNWDAGCGGSRSQFGRGGAGRLPRWSEAQFVATGGA